MVTHSPPLGYLDIWKRNKHWGCAELLNAVEKRVRPRFHVFGHVHEKNGAVTNDQTIFINASICSHSCEILNDPVLFDIALPYGANRKTF